MKILPNGAFYDFNNTRATHLIVETFFTVGPKDSVSFSTSRVPKNQDCHQIEMRTKVIISFDCCSHCHRHYHCHWICRPRLTSIGHQGHPYMCKTSESSEQMILIKLVNMLDLAKLVNLLIASEGCKAAPVGAKNII